MSVAMLSPSDRSEMFGRHALMAWGAISVADRKQAGGLAGVLYFSIPMVVTNLLYPESIE